MRALPIDPSNRTVSIGPRLRAARQSLGLTMDEVAQIAGLTKGFLSRIERDMTSPSVSTLVTLCDVLSITVGSLFEEPQIEFVAAGTGPRINLGGFDTEERLLTPRTEARVQVIRSVVTPGGHGGKDLYTVDADIDCLHLLRGDLTVRFSDRDYRLAAGDTLTFEGREPHSWHVNDDEGAEILWILVPAPWHP